MGIKVCGNDKYIGADLRNIICLVKDDPDLLGKPLPMYMLDRALFAKAEKTEVLSYFSNGIKSYVLDPIGNEGTRSINSHGGWYPDLLFGYMRKGSGGDVVDIKSVNRTVSGGCLGKDKIRLTLKMWRKLKWAYQQIDKLYPELVKCKHESRLLLPNKKDCYFVAESFFLLDAAARETANGRRLRAFKPMALRIDEVKVDVSALMRAEKWLSAFHIQDDVDSRCGEELYFLPLYSRFYAKHGCHLMLDGRARWVKHFPGFVLRIRVTDSGSAWAVGFTTGDEDEVSVLKYGRSGGDQAKKAALSFVKSFVTSALLGELDKGRWVSLYFDRNQIGPYYKLTPVNCTLRECVMAIDNMWNAALEKIKCGKLDQKLKDFYLSLFDHTPAIYLENCHEKD